MIRAARPRSPNGRPYRAERGAAAVQYAGVLVLAALLLGALYALGVQAKTTSHVGAATCEMFQARRDCTAARGGGGTHGESPEKAPAKPQTPEKRHDDGCHGIWGCTWRTARGVAHGAASAFTDNVTGVKKMLTTNPVTTGKGMVAYLWSKSGGSLITGVKACGAGATGTCVTRLGCALIGPQCLVDDMVYDEKTKEDLAGHHWTDAVGRVGWNVGSMFLPSKIPGLNKLGKVERGLGDGGKAAKAPGSADSALKDAEKDLGNVHDAGGLPRKFEKLSPADRTKLLDEMSEDDLRAFYEAGAYGKNVRSDLLQAASPRALAKLDPKPPKFTDSGGWYRFTGRLWRSWPAPRDIAQGPIGDCWCLSSMGAMTVSPRGGLALEHMITKNPNGTYTVAFGDGVRVTVTDALPKNGAHVTEEAGWPAIMEKAMAARLPGGYDELGKANRAAVALEWLTGNKVDEFRANYDMPRTATVRGWLDEHDPVVVRFPEDVKIDNALERGIVSFHKYAVREANPYTRTITLVNPHGPTSKVVTISEDELMHTKDVYLFHGRLK